MAKVREQWGAHTKAMTAMGVLSEVEVTYIVSEVADEDEALNAVRNFVPKFIDFLYLSSVEIDERRTETVFVVNAIYSDEYVDEDTAEDEEATVQYDSGSGTKRMLNAYSQRLAYGVDQGAGTAIVWNGETGDKSSITGVDVPNSTPRKSFTIYKKRSSMTTAWEHKIEALTGCVNSKTFKGYDEGECMFTGMSFNGTDTSSSVLAVTFNFLIKKNETDQTYDGYSLGKVEGFEYPWAMRKNGAVVAIYVAQIAKKADLNNLGV